jgi:hypothetical protein
MITPLLYTYKLDRLVEHARQELITKLIKMRARLNLPTRL